MYVLFAVKSFGWVYDWQLVVDDVHAAVVSWYKSIMAVITSSSIVQLLLLPGLITVLLSFEFAVNLCSVYGCFYRLCTYYVNQFDTGST